VIGVPDLLTTPELAHALGYVDRSAIHARIARGDVRLAGCRLPGRARRSWSRARLIAGGYLTPPAAPVCSDPVTLPAVVVATWRIA
jgi:hypothetical protein